MRDDLDLLQLHHINVGWVFLFVDEHCNDKKLFRYLHFKTTLFLYHPFTPPWFLFPLSLRSHINTFQLSSLNSSDRNAREKREKKAKVNPYYRSLNFDWWKFLWGRTNGVWLYLPARIQVRNNKLSFIWKKKETET